MRLDLWLVKFKKIPSRAKAQELIRSGQVFKKVKFAKSEIVNNLENISDNHSWKIIKQSSFEVGENENPQDYKVHSEELLKYVSRGGLKLEGAIKYLNLKVSGLRALDIGQSTGGFTDCLVQFGCEMVVGVEVGTNQLHDKLKTHPQILTFENTHINKFDKKEFENFFDFVVVDVSFISLTQVLPHINKFLKANFGQLLALVKPQFEVGSENLTKKGIVKDSRLYDQVKDNIVASSQRNAFHVLDYFESPILGGDGNKEFFVYLKN